MRRRNGEANNGLVAWPTQLENSQEGGMYVYAVVGAVDVDGLDGYANCIAGLPRLPLDTLLDPDSQAGVMQADGSQKWPLEEEWFPEQRGNTGEDAFRGEVQSKDLYAAVLLGTSGGSWLTAESDHWVCKREDLLEEGESLVASLEKLYGQKVTLLTFLDT